MATYHVKVRPTIGGAWDSTTAYDFYTTVYDPDTGNSYISLKDVPAGTALTETSCWQLFSNNDARYDNMLSIVNAAKAELDAAYQEYITEIEEKAADIENMTTDADAVVKQALEKATNAENETAEFSNQMDELESEITSLKSTSGSHCDALEVDSEGLVYLLNNGERIAGPYGPFAGTGSSGSGSGNNATLTVANTTGWLSTTVTDSSSCTVKITWSSTEDDLETGDGTATVKVGGITKAILNVQQGEVTIDLKEYLSTGSNTVKLTIADVYENSRTINFSVTVVSLSISSTFDDTAAYQGAISFPYTPVGSVSKTVHFLLDGEEVGTNTTSVSNRQMSYTISAQSHGAHTFEVYFDCTINGQTVESNHLYYEIICIESLNKTPIIACSFAETTVTQYATVNIPYTVYDPTALTAEVTIAVNGTTASTQTVDRTQQTYSYRADTIGSVTITITSGTASKGISFTVTESEVQTEAETEDLVLYLTSEGRSNNEAEPGTWSYGDIYATFTGFNWSSDGWQADDDGETVLRVAGDARVSIPYTAFADDFRTTGKTIEIDFETRNVMNYDTVVMSCLSGGRGFSLTPQLATLTSEQSTLSMQYKEDEHVRITFVAEKRTENRLLYVYVNGIMSGTVQYPSSDDFAQASPVGISIGSNDSTIDIYAIRIYDNDLTREQVLNNWIADTRDVDEMVARYKRNSVYDDYGNIVIAKLPSDLPYMILTCEELPQYKGDKKTVSVTYVDPVNTENSFTATGASANVQGTSSQYYARKNYKISFKGGFEMNDGTHTDTYALRSGAIATAEFCLKADVASSEGANNVELARLYNDTCPYQTPPQEENSAVRQGIDGFPIVMFWNDGTDTTFLGKYNFNNDKGTAEVFGFATGDESWEVLNNTSNRVLFQDDDFTTTDWQNDFESRYPEDNFDTTQLAAFVSWVKSTDQSAATGEALDTAVTYDDTEYTTDTAAYRLAKFKAELSDYMEVNAVEFYYLFTELFLMVDSRAKNAFWTAFMSASGKWFSLPYDFDTAIGTNNEGTLAFSYNLEDIDTTDAGADVFNGQGSVLWVNLRAAFYDEMKAMYQNLRSTGSLSYDKVETAFEEHQGKWPEAVFNEDSYFKYIQPLVEDGTGSYLSMLQGSKAEQRKWWLYNRFRYIDSKYNAGDALSDVIQLRGYAKANVTVTPYADVYAGVKYGSYLVQERAERNTAYELVCPLDNVNDTEIYIYSASQLASVGDLSGLLVGFADFSMGTKLQSIKLGDSADSYANGNLTELYLGNNVLLRTLDVRNCTALKSSVDVSGCTNIEEIYFDGTAITGIDLPSGGILKVLHLPSTITNLTIRNQTAITDLSVPSYANITTLWIDNVSDAVDAIEIVSQIAAGSRVRIMNVAIEAESADEIGTFYDLLDTMRGLDEKGGNTDQAQVSGTIHVSTIPAEDLESYSARYPYLTISADTVTCTLSYYTYDGATLLYEETVTQGSDGSGYTTKPSRESTAQYSYTFVGWSTTMNATAATTDAEKAVTADRNLYAAYTSSIRKYTVKWVNSDGTTLETDRNVAYGTTPTYNGSTPTNSSGDEFTGWEPEITAVTGDITYTASFTPVYNAYFYNGSTLLATVKTKEGATPVYSGETPVSSLGDAEDYPFEGWNPELGPITADTSYYAVFGSPLEETEITDDWDTILANVEAGTAKTTYKIGNYKSVDLGDLGTVNMQIAARGKEELADGSGTAQLSFICKELPLISHRMNPSLVSNYDYSSQTSWYESKTSSYYRVYSRTYPQEADYDTNFSSVITVPSTAVSYKITVNGIPSGKTGTLTIDDGTAQSWSSTTTSEITLVSTTDVTGGSTMTIAFTAVGAAAGNSSQWQFRVYFYNSSGSAVSCSSITTTFSANSNTYRNSSASSYDDATGAIGGWDSCELRYYLQDEVLPLLPEAIQNAIKTVVKTQPSYNTAGTKETQTSNDTIWIPSYDEVFGSSGIYRGLFPDQASRVKTKVGASSASWWWLRSAYNVTTFFGVYSSGSYYLNNANDSGAVAFGFCI